MYFVYLLENKIDKSWYTGFTSDLKRRILEHNSQKGGRTTKLKRNWEIIYFGGYGNKLDAMGREKFLKSGSGKNYFKKQLKHYLTKNPLLKEKLG